MAFLRSFRIGTRLYAAFLSLLLLLLAVAAMGWFSTSRTAEGLRVVYQERAVPVQQLAQVNHLLQRNRLLIMDMLIRPDRSNVESRTAEITRNHQVLQDTWVAYRAQVSGGEVAALVQAIEGPLNTYLQKALVPAAKAMAQDDFDEASFLYMTQVNALAPRVEGPIDALLSRQIEWAGHEYERSTAFTQTVNLLLAFAVLLAIGLGLGLAWAITRSITQPLGQAVAVARTVAEGDLTSDILVQGRDEASQLLAALATMNHSLVRIVSEVRRSSGHMVVASSHFASDSTALSQRTEEQAAYLQQTAASIEQITSTVQNSAQSASEASRLAQDARQAAVHGGAVVAKVVSTMRGISTSSRKVSDITSVIDSIAFQTNILALNAAVEAARAGEQGRGFAVVAGEVRNLAQRCAAAASEIKSLIDASAAQVETGALLVEEAGQSVQAIVDQVQKMSTLIAAISTATVEQSAGVAQVGGAMARLDGMTQENATLVDGSSALAERLQQHAGQLEDLVSVFRLQDWTMNERLALAG